MQTDFLGLSLSRQEALECLRACMAQALVEDETRVQQGLEPLDDPPLVRRFLQLLRISDQEADEIANRVSDDLWAYSWYVYTNEWAWFRAKQEAQRQMRGQNVNEENAEFRRLAERLYKKNFETYAKEIDMQSPPTGYKHAQEAGKDKF